MTELSVNHDRKERAYVPGYEVPCLREDHLGRMRKSRRHGPQQRAGQPVVWREALQQRDRRRRAATKLDVLEEEERLTICRSAPGIAQLRT